MEDGDVVRTSEDGEAEVDWEDEFMEEEGEDGIVVGCQGG